MSKNIDADVLKAEIEKRKNICKGIFERDSDTYYQGKAVAYQETLSFIDTLQQEHLEVEIKRYIPRNQCPVPDLMEAVARHFAKWQKEQMLKDAVEGEVMMNALHPHEPRVTASYPNCPYKFGDKVKIVIVPDKEDKK